MAARRRTPPSSQSISHPTLERARISSGAAERSGGGGAVGVPRGVSGTASSRGKMGTLSRPMVSRTGASGGSQPRSSGSAAQSQPSAVRAMMPKTGVPDARRLSGLGAWADGYSCPSAVRLPTDASGPAVGVGDWAAAGSGASARHRQTSHIHQRRMLTVPVHCVGELGEYPTWRGSERPFAATLESPAGIGPGTGPGQ